MHPWKGYAVKPAERNIVAVTHLLRNCIDRLLKAQQVLKYVHYFQKKSKIDEQRKCRMMALYHMTFGPILLSIEPQPFVWIVPSDTIR